MVSAKECVTTHPPKCMAPTMDGAQALVFYPTYTDAVSEWHFPTVNAGTEWLEACWMVLAMSVSTFFCPCPCHVVIAGPGTSKGMTSCHAEVLHSNVILN